jgi:tetratricopeptide (TPR) repeat protein
MPTDIDQALTHHQAGRLDQAEAAYREILAHEPENPDALHLLGVLCHQCGDHEKAKTRIERAIQLRPQVAMYHNNLGEALRALGQHEQAVAAYRQALSLRPDYAEAHNNLGLALEALGRLSDAVTAFRQALALSADPQVHCNLASALRRQHRLEEAAAAYEAAVRLHPDFAEGHNDLGVVLTQQGQLTRAIAEFRRALTLRPDFAQAYGNLGMALEQQGQLAEAAIALQQAVSLLPRAQTYCSLGDVLRRQGEHTAAVAAYKKAIQHEPDHAEAHVGLGIALKEQGDLDTAILAYERAIALKPDHAIAHFGLGNALRRQGRLEDAIAAYERAVACRPKFAEAYASIATVLVEQDRFQEARERYYRLFRVTHGNALWDAQTFVSTEFPETALKSIRTSKFDLTSITEQLAYLLDEKKVDPSFRQMLSLYESVLGEIDPALEETDNVTLTPEQSARIAPFRHKVVHYVDTPAVLPHAVNPKLNFAEIEDAYLASPVAVVHFDDFLTPQALNALWQFCLDATIFFARGPGKIMTSYLGTGFHSSLLFQIAAELKQRFPRVLGRHVLGNMWAYRYPPKGEGVGAHTDEGAVTFNFWITPNEANLEPGTGGLIVHAKEQPMDWDWNRFNFEKDRPAVRATLEEFLRSAEKVVIPYRRNRALLFHSNLFHRSDSFHFKVGHRHRRTNITILFGERGTDIRLGHIE